MKIFFTLVFLTSTPLIEAQNNGSGLGSFLAGLLVGRATSGLGNSGASNSLGNSFAQGFGQGVGAGVGNRLINSLLGKRSIESDPAEEFFLEVMCSLASSTVF